MSMTTDMGEPLPRPAVKKNKGGRPRKSVAPAPILSDDQFAQLLGAIGKANTGGGLDPELLKEALAGAAVAAATHTAHVANPSNTNHPGKSVFNYPEGEVARPKPVPPFAFLYNGYPCTKFMETEHWRECELMGAVTPGEYTVIRTDGSKMGVVVKGETDADGKLTKVDVQFPVSREERVLVPPKAVVLYQIVHAKERTPRQLFVEGMTEWLNITLGDPVSA
jgi:hypothetical protein